MTDLPRYLYRHLRSKIFGTPPARLIELFEEEIGAWLRGCDAMILPIQKGPIWDAPATPPHPDEFPAHWSCLRWMIHPHAAVYAPVYLARLGLIWRDADWVYDQLVRDFSAEEIGRACRSLRRNAITHQDRLFTQIRRARSQQFLAEVLRHYPEGPEDAQVFLLSEAAHVSDPAGWLAQWLDDGLDVAVVVQALRQATSTALLCWGRPGYSQLILACCAVRHEQIEGAARPLLEAAAQSIDRMQRMDAGKMSPEYVDAVLNGRATLRHRDALREIPVPRALIAAP